MRSANNCPWNLLAPIDLNGREADKAVDDALALAGALRGDLTLVSVLDRRRFERGIRQAWPSNAFGSSYPNLDVHRVILPGSPAEAITTYADKIQADLIVISASYSVRRWFRKLPLATSIAALTSRCLWITPRTTEVCVPHRSLRVACLMRLDGTDERLCLAAQALVERCGGELVLVHAANSAFGQLREVSAPVDASAAMAAISRAASSVAVPWTPLVVQNSGTDALIDVAREHGFDLLMARRPMYVTSTQRSGDLLALAPHLPCPLLSVPISSTSTGQSASLTRSPATA